MSKLVTESNIKTGSIRDIGRELSSIKTGVKLVFICDSNIPKDAIDD